MKFGRTMRRLAVDDAAQVLPVVALSMFMLIGMMAIGIDSGRAMYTSRALQSATDAAALAGAQALTTTTTGAQVTAAIQLYSAQAGEKNASTSLPSVTLTSTLKCYATLQAKGQACTGALPYNGVKVTQTTVLPMFFFGVFGHPTMTLTATSSASSRGGTPRPSNIAIIVDTTLSMTQVDTNCGGLTQQQCALNGVQILLQSLSPCGLNVGTCANGNGVISDPFDAVSLFTFPNVQLNTASIDTGCSTGPFPSGGYYNMAPYGNFSILFGPPNQGSSTGAWSGAPTALPYSFPTPGVTYQGISSIWPQAPTYQITPFLNDYRTSDQATTLNPASALVKAAAGGGCYGMIPPNYEANYETYYASALYAAQSALAAQAAAHPGSENVIIFLSDGDSNAWAYGGALLPQTNIVNMQAAAPPALYGSYMTATATGLYPSWVNECQQAVLAAQAATTAGTLVYSVAYGSEPTGCSTDQAGYTGNSTLPGNAPTVTPSGLTPCNTMAGIASAPQYFYSDYNQSGQASNCISSQQVTSLAGIFQAIANDLTHARLIPNSTT